ncbi:G-protein alpha subunit [Balamuthia mandrillaris]
MGCGASSATGDKEQADKNKDINKHLADEKRRLENEVKLLLLGAGESGKSTIAKQMRIIHKDGFSAEDRKAYKSIIYNNAISSMRALCQACEDLGIQIAEESAEASTRMLENDEFMNGGEMTQQIAADIKTLWQDEGIRSAFARSNEFQLNDSAAYYFDKIDNLAAAGYVPDEQDVLRSRAKTTGIIETEFDVDKTHFRMVDVGGQRSERKKWMHCFQDVTAVIFCVALSEYDLKLYEDDSTNRMHESLKLFKEICNNKWFMETSMILFLNKKDLFQDKIKRVPLTVCFPEYNGGQEFEGCSSYIREQFVAQNDQPKKHIYPHITCATDTDNIMHVFNAVKDIILHKALDDSGLGL